MEGAAHLWHIFDIDKNGILVLESEIFLQKALFTLRSEEGRRTKVR